MPNVCARNEGGGIHTHLTFNQAAPDVCYQMPLLYIALVSVSLLVVDVTGLAVLHVVVAHEGGKWYYFVQ